MRCNNLAQLIKLKDYISRYEWNAYRYPSQYIRLKQANWQKLYDEWKEHEFLHEEPYDQARDEETSNPFSRLMSFMTKEHVKRDADEPIQSFLPPTEKELKRYFLDKLYPFQLKWATSTVTDVSFVDQGFETDETLKYFLQRFPDIYLIMYYPIFNIKYAPVDGEIIIISPIGIEIIYLLEEAPETTIMASDERVWTFETGNEQVRKLSPVIALKRTEQIIKSILKHERINFSIEKTILSRTNNIVFASEPYNINIVGKYQYKKWFQAKRQLSSPLKSEQLKVIEALLKHCMTSSVRRPEWEEDTNDLIIGSEE